MKGKEERRRRENVMRTDARLMTNDENGTRNVTRNKSQVE